MHQRFQQSVFSIQETMARFDPLWTEEPLTEAGTTTTATILTELEAAVTLSMSLLGHQSGANLEFSLMRSFSKPALMKLPINARVRAANKHTNTHSEARAELTLSNFLQRTNTQGEDRCGQRDREGADKEKDSSHQAGKASLAPRCDWRIELANPDSAWGGGAERHDRGLNSV